MLTEVRKFVAPELIFGIGARYYAGQYAVNIGTEKALIVTDKLITNYPWFLEIIETLKQAEIDFVIFDDITINPKDYECHLGAEIYEKNNCNTLIAIGGGSVIDCAKGIGILVSNGGKITDYEGVDNIKFPIPPLLCIPTTSGSSADVSQFTIITNTKFSYKMAIASKMIVPDIALIDPVVTLTKSFDLTVDTGIDALSHAIEAYGSNASSSITDLHALYAIKNIVITLPLLTKELDNLEYRMIIMQACLDAGFAFSNASLGLVHALAHAIGGRYDLIHGELNGLLLEHVISFNEDKAIQKYKDIKDIFVEYGGFDPQITLSEIIRLFIYNIRPNSPLGKAGYDKDQLEDLAQYVLNDPCIVTNPKEVEVEDVVKIYEKIF